MKLLELFYKEGKQEEIRTGVPFFLRKRGSVYAFEKGTINLFAQKNSKVTSGARQFLAHFSQGLLFNHEAYLEKDSYQIFIISETDLTIYELSEELLSKRFQQDPDLASEFVEFLDRWIYHLPQNLTNRVFVESKYCILPGNGIELPAGQLLVSKSSSTSSERAQVSWIQINEGKISLYGSDEFSLIQPEQIFPLTSQSWFEAKEKAKIEAMTTKSLVQSGLWPQALTTFHQFLIGYLPIYLEELHQTSQKILQSRKTEEAKNLTKTFKEIESLFSSSVHADVEKIEGALEQACQILAKRMKIDFVFPQVDKDKIRDLSEHVELICEASRVRVRRVKLTKNWWKEDHGSLLGILGKEQHPVALMKERNYRLVDIKSNQEITASIAQNLSEYAYMFYVPFSSTLTKGKELLQLIFQRFKRRYSAIVSFAFLGSLLTLLPPIFTNLLFTYAVPEGSLSLSFYLMMGLIISAVGITLFYFLREQMLLKIEGLIANLVQSAFWDRLLKLSPRFFRKFTVGNLFWRTMTIENIRLLISGNTAAQLFTSAFSIFYLIVMWVFSPALTIVVTLVTLLGGLVTVICCFSKLHLLRRALEIQGKIRGNTVQMIGGVGKLRTSAAERNAFARWTSLYTDNTSLEMKIQHRQNIVRIMSSSLPILSYFGIYFAMLNWGYAQTISLPNFLAFTVAFGGFSLAIFPLNNTLMDLVMVVPMWERARVILEEPLEQKEDRLDPGRLSGKILIDNVSFGYDPDRPPVLKDISISTSPHEFVGIVGRSGIGKSTLIRLLLGFEKPQMGAVYYDEKDLEKLDVRAVRRQLGVVLQGSGVMAGSVYDNIACGGLFDEAQIEEAFKLSGFDEVLEDLPMGIHTFVQMNGTNLSGGQTQRLLLARALLGSPSILLFDEATSALDNRTQKKIAQNIQDLNVTRIVIAQRLSTIRHADRIYVLGQSGIEQVGTFDELTRQSGLFSSMLLKQGL